jgi:hypothetical protein
MHNLDLPAPVRVGFLPGLLNADGDPRPVQIAHRGGNPVILAFSTMAAVLAARDAQGGSA